MMENLYIGIEIGATKQQAALGTADGRLLHTITGCLLYTSRCV